MTPVFILSLPRSRTAWLATFFCHGDTYALHEGLIQCASVPELKTLMESTGRSVVVNSDCGNVLFLEEIRKTFPQAKYIVIERPYEEVAQELADMGVPDKGEVLLSLNLLEEAKEELKPLVIQYHALNQEACAAMCEYIGIPFDAQRWAMLDGMDIKLIWQKKVQYVNDNVSRIASLVEGNKWLGYN